MANQQSGNPANQGGPQSDQDRQRQQQDQNKQAQKEEGGVKDAGQPVPGDTNKQAKQD